MTRNEFDALVTAKTFASIFKAHKSSDFKHECIIHYCEGINADGWIKSKHFATKPEAKAWAKEQRATPHNY